MLVKKITYKDFLGQERTEEHMFNLNESELLGWLTTEGDYTLDKYLVSLQQERNGKKIIENFEQLLKLSYGKQSLDGRLFVKNDEVWESFRYSNAYDVLFKELVYDAHKAAEFIKAIIPPEMTDNINKALSENPQGIPDELKDYLQESRPYGTPRTMPAPAMSNAGPITPTPPFAPVQQ